MASRSRCPAGALILRGDSDRLISAGASKAMHGVIPGSTLRIFPGMGHELPRPLWTEIVANAGRVAGWNRVGT